MKCLELTAARSPNLEDNSNHMKETCNCPCSTPSRGNHCRKKYESNKHFYLYASIHFNGMSFKPNLPCP